MRLIAAQRHPQRAGEPLTKICGGRWGCGELRWIEEFRVHTTGGRATYCGDCERQFNRFRGGWDSVYDPFEIPAGLNPLGQRV